MYLDDDSVCTHGCRGQRELWNELTNTDGVGGIYNHGKMSRDFTYIDDLVEAVSRLSALPPVAGGAGASPVAPYRTINLGGGTPVSLMDFVEAVEAAVGKPAVRNYMQMQKGDVPVTFASAALLEKLTGYKPATPVLEGVARFVKWYRGFYGL